MRGRHAMRGDLRDQWPWLALLVALALLVLVLWLT